MNNFEFQPSFSRYYFFEAPCRLIGYFILVYIDSQKQINFIFNSTFLTKLFLFFLTGFWFLFLKLKQNVIFICFKVSLVIIATLFLDNILLFLFQFFNIDATYSNAYKYILFLLMIYFTDLYSNLFETNSFFKSLLRISFSFLFIYSLFNSLEIVKLKLNYILCIIYIITPLCDVVLNYKYALYFINNQFKLVSAFLTSLNLPLHMLIEKTREIFLIIFLLKLLFCKYIFDDFLNCFQI